MNQYKGEVKGKLGDKERTFRLTFESIVNILHEGLKGAGQNVIQKAVGDMIMQSGIIKASETAGTVLASAFTGENKGDDNPLAPAENIQKDTQSKNA